MLIEIVKAIKNENLLEQVRVTGDKLKEGLSRLEQEFPQLLNSTRGRGTFLAVSAASSKLREDLLHRLKQKGELRDHTWGNYLICAVCYRRSERRMRRSHHSPATSAHIPGQACRHISRSF